MATRHLGVDGGRVDVGMNAHGGDWDWVRNFQATGRTLGTITDRPQTPNKLHIILLLVIHTYWHTKGGSDEDDIKAIITAKSSTPLRLR